MLLFLKTKSLVYSPPASEWQQSTSESKPSEAGQLFDPQARPSWQSSWASQSPSFSEQALEIQNPISPLHGAVSEHGISISKVPSS